MPWLTCPQACMQLGKAVPTEGVGAVPRREGLGAEQAQVGDVHHRTDTSSIPRPGTNEQLCECLLLVFPHHFL